MDLSKKAVGAVGEDIACGYLEGNGYKIIARNFNTTFGELDIISKSPDKMLVFIEVKSSRVTSESGNVIRQSYPHDYTPEMNLNNKKLHKLRRLCEWYINKFFPENDFRVDGICIDIFPDGTYALRHYENIIFK